MQRIPAFTGVVVLAMCILWGTLGSRLLPAARSHDFLNLYTGASLALEGRFADLHAPEVQLARERRIFPRLPALVPFVRPVAYAALLSPLALLPYEAAFRVWIAAQVVLLLACWAWGWWRFGPNALVFAAMYLPAPLGIATGQDCVVMLALFIVAYELAERKRWFAAGGVLALMLMKFHLMLLWPVALLIQRRWRMLAGFCAVAAAEAGACMALGGVRSLRLYAALLDNKNLAHLSPSPELMISASGLAANIGIDSSLAIVPLASVVIAIFVWAVKDAPLWRMFALTAVASLWIVPHVYSYDATLLTLPIWLVIHYSARPVSRIAATLLSTPLSFGFALAGAPWAIVSSASVAAFFAILAGDRKPVDTANKPPRS